MAKGDERLTRDTLLEMATEGESAGADGPPTLPEPRALFQRFATLRKGVGTLEAAARMAEELRVSDMEMMCGHLVMAIDQVIEENDQVLDRTMLQHLGKITRELSSWRDQTKDDVPGTEGTKPTLCSYCSAELQPDARFCSTCAAPCSRRIQESH